MRLRYRIGETLRTVTIERSGEEYRATTGERTFHVAVTRTDGPRLDLVIDGRSVTVFIAAAGDRRIVKLGAAEPITLERVAAREGRARAPIPGEDTVTAVMEGVVTAVAAREGETVPSGAPLVVLEAMKMEMRLVAPFAARVKRVACAVGDVVARGSVLVELEPSAK